MKLDRLLSIMIILLNKDKVSAQDLADRFGVTVRTIYRDLEALDGAGIPIVSYSGPGGGYCIDSSYTIDRRLLSFDDLRAIIAALKGVSAATGGGSIGSALEKITSMVPRGKSAEGFEDRIVIDLFPWGRRSEERVLAKVLECAIAERRIVRFEYASYGREKEARTVEPMTLVFKSYAWYVWAYCRARGDFRLFKLARMRNLKSSMERFERRSAVYEADAVTPSAERIEADILFSADRISDVEEWFPSEDVERYGDGRLRVRMRVPEGDWLVNVILGFGGGVEVLAPAPLREKVREVAEKIAIKNKNS